jgi:hypothetical protein
LALWGSSGGGSGGSTSSGVGVSDCKYRELQNITQPNPLK